jgi:putative hemolysin
MSELFIEIVALLLLVTANGFFAMAEMALVSARARRLQLLADDGDERAKIAVALIESPTRFLSTVQFGVTLSGIAAGAYGGAAVSHHLNGWLIAHFPAYADYAKFLSFGLVVTGIAFFTIVLGELVPKRLAMANAETCALWIARPIAFVARIASPFVWLLSACTDALARLFGAKATGRAPITNDEVASLLEQGMHTGAFHKGEKDMVDGVLSLDHLPVTAIMTPRPKMVWLNVDEADETNWRKILTSGHSQFPVYQKHRDNVLGMVHVKALWANAAFNLPTNLRNLMTPLVTVPETYFATAVLEQFKRTGKHVALVVDEFGGIQGMVTLIDVLEAIVGDMPDQMSRAQPEAKRRDDGSWLIDATLPTEEIKDLLKLRELRGEDEADFQTLGGFVVTQLGRIPAAGDHFDWAGWRFEVLDMDRNRVDKVLVARTPPPAATQQAAS